MNTVKTILAAPFILLIKFYQLCISPLPELTAFLPGTSSRFQRGAKLSEHPDYFRMDVVACEVKEWCLDLKLFIELFHNLNVWLLQ